MKKATLSKVFGALLSTTLISTQVIAKDREEEIINFDGTGRSCLSHSNITWGYYGQVVERDPKTGVKPIMFPGDWSRLYNSCGKYKSAQHRQSPIELPKSGLLPKDLSDLSLGHYPPLHFNVAHNCHTLQATVTSPWRERGENLLIDGQPYRLVQFHFHTPSEHMIDHGDIGLENFYAEVHFVHAAINNDGSIDSGRLAVVGVFIDFAEELKQDDQFADEWFRRLTTQYSPLRGEPTLIEDLETDLNDLFPDEKRGIYRYKGSLTTPPCSQIVDWIVFREPQYIHAETARIMREKKIDIGFSNARPAFKPTDEHTLSIR